jgi:hypothetical protein
VSFTRRTHIVRIVNKNDDQSSDTYIDVEVLDAISFRGENNKEMVLNCTASEASPYIVDDTGGNHAKKPEGATRRSHMKRIVGDDPTQKLDVEIIDCMAFSDENGKAWILDMSGTSDDPHIFDTTTGGGSGPSTTRRTHSEKLSQDRKSPNPSQFVTIERCDNIAFRTMNGEEMIISCPSNDDPNSHDPRADTFISSPKGYDPSDDNGPKPPISSDPSNYVAFVEGATGFMTGNQKIAQGPFWWIRKVNSGGGLLEIDWEYHDVPDTLHPTLTGFAAPISDLISLASPDISTPSTGTRPPISQRITAAMKSFYYMWNNISPPLTTDDPSHTAPPLPDTFIVWADSHPYPAPPGSGSSGFEGDFGTDEAAADAEAAALNADFFGRIVGYIDNGDGTFNPIFSGGSPPSHVIRISHPGVVTGTGKVTRGSQLFNLGKAKPAPGATASTKYVLTVQLPSLLVDYTFNFRTYKGTHTDFTTDPAGKPAWDLSDEVGIYSFKAHTAEGSTGPVTLKVEINIKSLSITGSRTS